MTIDTQTKPAKWELAPELLGKIEARKGLNIHQRIALVYGVVDAIAKTGYNTHDKYTYMTHEAISAALSGILSDWGIVIWPEIGEHSTATFKTKSGAEGTTAEAVFKVHVVNADNPTDEIVVPWWALADDYSDKHVNKVWTYERKYFLINFFFLSDQSVDDGDAGHKPPPANQQAQRQQSTTTTQSTSPSGNGNGNGKTAEPAAKPFDRKAAAEPFVKLGVSVGFVAALAGRDSWEKVEPEDCKELYPHVKQYPELWREIGGLGYPMTDVLELMERGKVNDPAKVMDTLKATEPELLHEMLYPD